MSRSASSESSRKKKPSAGTRPAAPQRDRSATEASLVAAVGQVLGRAGVSALGVNAVAQEAGVDKVLIYRYFGDLEGLVRAYAESADFWPTEQELLGDRAELLALPFSRRVSLVLIRYLEALRRRPLTLEILAGETVGLPDCLRPLEQSREALGERLLSWAAEIAPSPEVDLAAITALLAGGIQYLLIRSLKVAVFNGIPLDQDAGWQRLSLAVQMLVERALEVPADGGPA